LAAVRNDWGKNRPEIQRTRLEVYDPSTEGLERWIRTLLPACWYLVAQEAAKSCFSLRCGHHEALEGQD
jgi:hypothetical protein